MKIAQQIEIKISHSYHAAWYFQAEILDADDAPKAYGNSKAEALGGLILMNIEEPMGFDFESCPIRIIDTAA